MTLHLDRIVKRFGRASSAVLDGVTFDVPTGSLTCLLGPSGAGKTTILGVIAGLIEPEEGTVSLDGVTLDAVPCHRRPVTLLMQQPQLFPHLGVLENVAFGLRVRRVDRRTRHARALGLLEMVGIGHLADRSPQQLSGGEQQRVALARALAVEPRVLLADEPFASFDSPVRRDLEDLVVDLHRRLGTTVVMVTHDLDEALALGDQIVVLDHGRVCDAGPPALLYEHPTAARTARLLGFTNCWTGIVEHGQLHVAGHTVPVRRDNARDDPSARRSSTWAIRPEHVRLWPPGTVQAIAGHVSGLRYRGATVEARVEAGGLSVVAHLSPDRAPVLGATVAVELPVEHLIEMATEPGPAVGYRPAAAFDSTSVAPHTSRPADRSIPLGVSNDRRRGLLEESERSGNDRVLPLPVARRAQRASHRVIGDEGPGHSETSRYVIERADVHPDRGHTG